MLRTEEAIAGIVVLILVCVIAGSYYFRQLPRFRVRERERREREYYKNKLRK